MAQNGVDENPTALLSKALENGRIDALRAILSEISSRADFHELVDRPCSDNGDTLLHVAAASTNVDAVRALLHSGVNPCVQNNDGKTPLQVAKVGDAFQQALIQAAAHSNLVRVCQLLASGVPIDGVDSSATGNTALHYAACYGNEEVVRVLCDGGASAVAQNRVGETPLTDAVRRGAVDIVVRLLQHGADPSLKDAHGVDCYELAKGKYPQMIQTLSAHSVQQRLARSDTTSPQYGINGPARGGTRGRTLLTRGTLECWTDILWPQPKSLVLDALGRTFAIPRDRKLKVYIHSACVEDPRRIMHTFGLVMPMLQGLEVEWRGHAPVESFSQTALADGAVLCAVLPQVFDRSNSYSLTIGPPELRLLSSDLTGFRYALSTLAQIVKAHPDPNGGPDNLYVNVWTLPALTIRDGPDTKLRAALLDFTGCRILTPDTVCRLASQLADCKANQLFVHFELRTSDRFSLSYSQRDIFHLKQVMADLHVTLVPSLDLNNSYIQMPAAKETLQSFLSFFPQSSSVHFGPKLTEVALRNRAELMEFVRRSVPLIYVSPDSEQLDTALTGALPPYCVLCVSGSERLAAGGDDCLPPDLNLCLKFSTADVGYLCQAPENTVKNALLAARLGRRRNVLGTMVCDLSTGCEIIPRSLSVLPEIAILGCCWNRETDMKRFCFLLPQIAAEHILLDRRMSPLLEQALMLGYIEHELTRLGEATPTNNHTSPAKNTKSISVFVQMLLNPDNMMLERLTPVAFKKARIELKKSSQALHDVKKQLPYNYELALTLAEVQLVTDLMILASRSMGSIFPQHLQKRDSVLGEVILEDLQYPVIDNMGQALCTHGSNPLQQQTNGSFGSSVVNVGVGNLPLTARTDFANSLLEIRAKFQHTWLSRNIPSTLPNALKIFDNLFRTLLPASMQEYSDKKCMGALPKRVAVIVLALLSKREMWGVYAENLIRGVYFTVHVCLTTVETALRLVAGQVYAADRLLETFKCDVAEAVCRRYRSLCDERCSHLDRYQRHSHVHPQQPY